MGTICCAEDFAANEFHAKDPTQPWKDCLIGFFESLDDPAIAEALFAHAESWARQRGLNTLYGSFNLDYEDSYGVLIEGRDRPPGVLCRHTSAYYQEFFLKANR